MRQAAPATSRTTPPATTQRLGRSTASAAARSSATTTASPSCTASTSVRAYGWCSTPSTPPTRRPSGSTAIGGAIGPEHRAAQPRGDVHLPRHHDAGDDDGRRGLEPHVDQLLELVGPGEPLAGVRRAGRRHDRRPAPAQPAGRARRRRSTPTCRSTTRPRLARPGDGRSCCTAGPSSTTPARAAAPTCQTAASAHLPRPAGVPRRAVPGSTCGPQDPCRSGRWKRRAANGRGPAR